MRPSNEHFSARTLESHGIFSRFYLEMEIQVRLLIFIFLLSIGFGIDAQATFKEICFSSRQEMLSNAQTLHEMRLYFFNFKDKLDQAVERGEFYYFNPTLDKPGNCFTPLSLEEKIKQQAGQYQGNVVAPLLTGFRNSKLAQKLDSDKWSKYRLLEKRNEFLGGLRHPLTGWHARRIKQIRKVAEVLEKKYFQESGSWDEADAFRHFLGNVLTAQELGYDIARTASAVHELDDVSVASLMDRYNNLISIQWAKIQGVHEHPLMEEELVKSAIEMLETKKLVIIYSLKDPKARMLHYQHAEFMAWAQKVLLKRLP